MIQKFFGAYKQTGALHHAYLLEGVSGDSGALEKLFSLIESKLGVKTVGNPDFWYKEFETFGIGDSRDIKNLQARNVAEGALRLFVIDAKSFTTEAQNALLKVFEEPADSTHFIVIFPNKDVLLPTLRSRLFAVGFEDLDTQGDETKNLARKFLESTPPERFELLKSIVEEKDKDSAISFLNNLEEVLYEMQNAEGAREAYGDALREIIECKKYLNARGVSIKMILENISLVLPVVRNN